MPSASELHPAENRGLRELYAGSQQIVARWPRLARWMRGEEAEPVLLRGAQTARDLLAELAERTPRYGLYGTPGARGVGSTVGALRRDVADRFLERNQALRLGLVDVQHVRNLLVYLAEVADSRRDRGMAEFCRGWSERLAQTEGELAEVVAGLGRNPDRAIVAVDPSPAGTAARRTGNTVGALGEAIDRRLGPRS